MNIELIRFANRRRPGSGAFAACATSIALAACVPAAPALASGGDTGDTGDTVQTSPAEIKADKRDDVPVRGVISRKIDPAPAAADAIRVTVLGDGSGALFQIRLLGDGEDGVLTGYCASRPVPIDFKGWKTLVFPLSEFTFHADNNPESKGDGIGTVQALKTDTTLQIKVTSTSTRLYLDNLAWTTASAALTDPPVAMIDDFENAATINTNWTTIGDFNQIRAVTAGPNAAAAFVKDGMGSLSLTVRSAPLDEKQRNEAQIRKRLALTPKAPYQIYSRSPFETITPQSTPAFNEILATPTVGLFAAPGQIEPATLAVFASSPIKDATLTLATPLVSKTKGTIPITAVDLEVVRIARYPDGPEILMKDDREPLSGPLPKVRLTGNPTTDIPEDTSKQFWVTVHVPAGQAPGLYTGKLVFSAAGLKPQGVILNVDVLPLQLRTAHYQYGIDLTSVLGPEAGPGEQVVTPEILAAQLADIRDHNFKIVTLHDKPAALQNAMQIYKDSGISSVGPVVIASTLQSAEDFAAVEKMRSAVGLPDAFDIYYRLSPDQMSNADGVRDYAVKARAADKNALIVCPITSDSEYNDLSTEVGVSLAPMYTLSSDHAGKLRVAGKRATQNRDWWTWSIGENDAIRNRLYAGFLLFKTGNGLYGAFPGPYQWVPTGADPYTAFAAPDPTAGPEAAPKVMPQMATFPVDGGVLDTVQWEAVRAGIDDIRYMDVVKSISREMKDLGISPGETAYADSFLIGIVNKPVLTMTPKEIQDLRRTVAKQAVKLVGLLNKAPKAKAAE